jgi:hypothetical protein
MLKINKKILKYFKIQLTNKSQYPSKSALQESDNFIFAV